MRLLSMSFIVLASLGLPSLQRIYGCFGTLTAILGYQCSHGIYVLHQGLHQGLRPYCSIQCHPLNLLHHCRCSYRISICSSAFQGSFPYSTGECTLYNSLHAFRHRVEHLDTIYFTLANSLYHKNLDSIT